mgnify:CR=1 FL=1|jgi:hypothetical protein
MIFTILQNLFLYMQIKLKCIVEFLPLSLRKSELMLRKSVFA